MASVGSIWTDELIAELKFLWERGHSCSQIAAELGHGMTRNAVIGKAHRLKLPPRDRSIMNANGMARMIDPLPWSGGPRVPRGTTCKTVFRSRERKPRARIIDPNARPAIMTAISTLTGKYTGKVKVRRPTIGEMSKDQLRAMLADAVRNTAAMETQR